MLSMSTNISISTCGSFETKRKIDNFWIHVGLSVTRHSVSRQADRQHNTRQLLYRNKPVDIHLGPIIDDDD